MIILDGHEHEDWMIRAAQMAGKDNVVRTVFLSYSHSDHQNGAHQLIAQLLEAPGRALEATETQTILARGFREVVNGWREANGSLDPRQVVRAHLAAAWRHLQNLSDAEYDAVADDLGDEICALKALCDPDDWGPH
jgi:hypothetical protein